MALVGLFHLNDGSKHRENVFSLFDLFILRHCSRMVASIQMIHVMTTITDLKFLKCHLACDVLDFT